jgi:hypothetical protein
MLVSAAGGAETLDREAFQVTFQPMLYGVAVALLLTLLLRETGLAARRPAPAGARP